MRPLIAMFVGVLALALIATDGAQLTRAQTQGPIQSSEPILVELFTSQGCSSCPPADRLAAQLASHEDLVIISRPVTYWDRLGWPDTLAREENTNLQRAYARKGLWGYNGVYTPQSVIHGTYGEVGSNERALRHRIEQVSNERSAVIRVNRVADRGFAVGIAGETRNPAELVLVGISNSERIAIGRGENRGRSIDYTNVVVDERSLFQWTGGSHSHAINSSDLNIAGADRYALILREPHGGHVLAARWLN